MKKKFSVNSCTLVDKKTPRLSSRRFLQCSHLDLNQGPTDYESATLTN